MTDQKIQTALTKVKKRHPNVIFEPRLVETFIEKLSKLRTKYKPHEALQYALFECNLREQNYRAGFMSLAGTYFPRGKSKKKGPCVTKSIATERMLEDARSNESFHKTRQID